MLELRSICKEYGKNDSIVKALGGVDLEFRESEFVSILGPSGCGKTTLLNIIGGLDRYTSGDLIINGKSTKDFSDADWDTYRNHSIGFVFQSYNLIPHQTVLANVELALTLSGVSKAERRKRAAEALRKVGLGNQLNKKPNQMSGGQMQRVAIARALVNNPDILLADEPTGALDTQTSVQIMELLGEVAKDRLVIMVTHNPELAEQYSTRIVRLRDGLIVDDTNEYSHKAEPAPEKPDKKKAAKNSKKKGMSFLTAFSLSFNNLLTKKARTFLTSFAGSIGIIGIALILSLSNGIQAYIDRVQEDTLSTYPLSISAVTQDYAALLSAMTAVSDQQDGFTDENKIYVDDSLGTMMGAMSATVKQDLRSFKKYIEENYSKIEGALSDIQYSYDFDLQVFSHDGKTQVNPSTMFQSMGGAFAGMGELMSSSPMGGMSIMSQMIDNQMLLDQQYELVGENSHWPTNKNEVVLVVGKNNQISKMTLYMLGVLDQGELEEIMKDLMSTGEYDSTPMDPYDLDDFIGMKFQLLNTSDYYYESDKTYTVDGVEYPIWNDVREDIGYNQSNFVSKNGTELVISGIVRPRPEASAASISGAIGYTKALTDEILRLNSESKILDQQKNKTPEYNVLTGLKFERVKYTPQNIHLLLEKIDDETKAVFYGYVSQMMQENADFSTMFDLTTPEGFMGAFMLMPDELQTEIIASMLTAAQENSPIELFILLKFIITPMTEGIEVTADNLIRLLPIMSFEQKAVLLLGFSNPDIPALSLKGLMTLSGDVLTSEIHPKCTEFLKNMPINDELFAMMLAGLDSSDPMFVQLEETLYKLAPHTDATLESVLKQLGDADAAEPSAINFYAKDFASKEIIEEFINGYNGTVEKNKQITYTDIVGTLMSSVSIIIDVISYVLIAFVSISLVVSSIMIGIITYISVLERTKEIGILRSIGASKRDVSRVFNAETLIVGFGAGAIGILATILLCLPINAIIHALSGIDSVSAQLPAVGGIALVIISMLLTFVAGLIPSKIAAKKDPVVALRSE